jgi:hypothetical protein
MTLTSKSFQLSSVTPLDGQIVHLVFQDGQEFNLDLSPDLNRVEGPLVESLKNEEVFRQVRVEYGALVFPTGLDYGADVLRLWCENGFATDETRTEELVGQYLLCSVAA